MSCYYLEKEFYDYADDIEGVNIHYVCTPRGETPDWENQRLTRYMPLVQTSFHLRADRAGTTDVLTPTVTRLRKKVLKLPQSILDPQTQTFTRRYCLHHYFEIFQDGRRHYSPLYTEEITTETGSSSGTTHPADE